MSKVTTRRIALATMLALAGGAAVAQTASPPGGPGAPKGNWQPPSPAVMQRLLDGRIAMMKTALQLTPDQEKLWPAVEKAMRDNAADRNKAMADMRANAPAPGTAPTAKGPSARLEFMSKMETTRAQHSQRLADALKPLEATLTDDQKTILRIVSARGEGKGGMRGHGGPRGRF